MTRLGYQRRRESSWQWMIIGVFLGMGCSLVMLLTANVFGVVEFSSDTSTSDTEQVRVVTATSSTANPQTVVVVTATPDPALAGTNTTPAGSPTNLPGGVPATSPTAGSSSTPGLDPVQSVENTLVTAPQIGLLATPAIPEILAANMTPLIDVPGGIFKMGTDADEGRAAVADCNTRDAGQCQEDYVTDSIPPHDVQLSDFRIEQFEVTVGQYVNFLNYLIEQDPNSRPHITYCAQGPEGSYCARTTTDQDGQFSDIVFDAEAKLYSVRPSVVDRSNYPVTLVTWYGAQAYCEAIGRSLPTEAQWERAARGPSNWVYPWGQQWIQENAKTSRPTKDGTVEVDQYPSGVSAWGAFNMAGNVQEWVFDWYQSNFYTSSLAFGPDPKGPISGNQKVVRGGAWDFVPFFARSVHRRSESPGQSFLNLGFRCATPATPGSVSNTVITNPSQNNPAVTPTAAPTIEIIGTLAPTQ